MPNPTPLFPVLAWRAGEHVASYVARLARANGVTPRVFCSDLGLHWPSLCSSRDSQFDQLSWLTGYDVEQLLFWSAQQTGPSCYKVGKATAGVGAFVRATTRVCPVCMLDAIKHHGSHGPFQLVEWLLLPVQTCSIHKMPLLGLPNARTSHETYDVVRQVERHMPLIEVAAAEGEVVPSTAYETYMRSRIQSSGRRDWFADLGLSHVHFACLTLGSMLEFGPNAIPGKLNFGALRVACDRGYGVLKQGPDGLTEAMRQLKFNSKGLRPYFSSDLGYFYEWLKETVNEPTLGLMRETVLEGIRLLYPIRNGRVILGKEMTAQHSLTFDEARQKTGLGSARIKIALVKLGQYSEIEIKNLTELKPEEVKAAKTFWAGLVGKAEAAQLLGLDVVQVRGLFKAGVLNSERLTSSREYTPRLEVEALLEKVTSLPILKPNTDWVPLRVFCQRVSRPLPTVIAAWLQGDLSDIARQAGEKNLPNLLVGGLWPAKPTRPSLQDDLSPRDAARYLQINVSSIYLLLEGGLLQPIMRLNFETNRRRKFICQKSIRKFSQRYITLGQLAEHHKARPIHLAQKLDREGVETVACKSGFVRVYEKRVGRKITPNQI